MKRKLALITVALVLVGTLLLAACSDRKPGGTYTYREYQPGSPKTWNPHTWETATDRYILDYNTIGLYDFILNGTKDGYNIVPEMAASDPVDVTPDYKGNETYGVPAGATSGFAFKIALNEAAKWDDGTPINADTYVDSMQKMLDPDMLNRRADSYYTGMMVLANAERYFKQKSNKVYAPVVSPSGVAADVPDSEMYVSVTADTTFWGASITLAYQSYPQAFVIDNQDIFKILEEQCENARGGMIPLTAEIKGWFNTISAKLDDSASENSYKEWCFYVAETTETEPVSFDSVGIKKTGEYEITLILQKQISDFYLHYSLATNWIVHKSLYEANTKVVGEDGYKRTSYGTTADTTRSYGPYKLKSYQADRQITLTRNEYWYGYTDKKHEGQFQTTDIQCDIINESSAFQMFLKGDFDTVSLNADQLATYKSSPYLVYTPDSNTASVTINTDFNKLKAREKAGINKTILTYQKFREAISLSINRETFVNAINPAARPGYGIINNAYTADPDNGYLYRNYDDAKKALVEHNKLSYGDGSEYGSLDEAYDAVTNYDLTRAKTLFNEAYDEAIDNGHLKAGDKVELDYLVYSSGDWELWATLVNDAVQTAVQGTKFEGKVEIKSKVDQDYTNTMRAGGGDMCRAMWGGSDMDPFSIFNVYLDDTLKTDPGFSGDDISFSLEVEGKNYTKTLNQWNAAIQGLEGVSDNFSMKDVETKVKILAAMEKEFLGVYNTIPLYWRSVAYLNSKKVQFPTNSYVNLAGYGGIRFMTYKMDDSEWADFIKNSNNLKYE